MMYIICAGSAITIPGTVLLNTGDNATLPCQNSKRQRPSQVAYFSFFLEIVFENLWFNLGIFLILGMVGREYYI